MRRDHDPVLARLRALPLFAACPRPELALVLRSSSVHRSRAGEVLIEQGAAARELVVLLEGGAVVEVDGRPIARLGPGDVAGEIALLDKGLRTATVVAETDVQALVSTAHELSLLLTHAPVFTRALLTATASRLRSSVTSSFWARDISLQVDIPGPEAGQAAIGMRPASSWGTPST